MKRSRIILLLTALMLTTGANIKAQTMQEVDFNIWPKGELNTAYAQYFIGNSYLAPLDAKNGGPVNETF